MSDVHAFDRLLAEHRARPKIILKSEPIDLNNPDKFYRCLSPRMRDFYYSMLNSISTMRNQKETGKIEVSAKAININSYPDRGIQFELKKGNMNEANFLAKLAARSEFKGDGSTQVMMRNGTVVIVFQPNKKSKD